MENFVNNEIWRPIVGYEGLYEVSNLGNVRSLDRVVKQACCDGSLVKHTYRGRVLKPVVHTAGYCEVTLSRGREKINHLVHRLVAEAFIENPHGLPQINHKDENKTNNRAENLEWCDQRYNNNYGNRQKKVNDKISTPIYQIDLKGNIVARHETIADASRKTKIPYGNIRAVAYKNPRKIRGKNYIRKTAGGYFWITEVELHHLGYEIV